eukprot:scaffold10388_cov57-Phaeocystis_antarctica.AAC.1
MIARQGAESPRCIHDPTPRGIRDRFNHSSVNEVRIRCLGCQKASRCRSAWAAEPDRRVGSGGRRAPPGAARTCPYGAPWVQGVVCSSDEQ